MEEQPGQVDGGYEYIRVAEMENAQDTTDEGKTECNQEIQGTE